MSGLIARSPLQSGGGARLLRPATARGRLDFIETNFVFCEGGVVPASRLPGMTGASEQQQQFSLTASKTALSGESALAGLPAGV